MTQLNSGRQYAPTIFIDRLDEVGTARVLDRLPLSPTTDGGDGGGYSEAWLQRLVQRFPQTLPIAEIEPGFAGAASVCMELPTPAGIVDNLFATSRGDLVLAECKLWRNPEARRKVVAQIIDYAHGMAAWSYEDLEAAVAQGITPESEAPARSLYDMVGGDQEMDEASFVDAVARNLRLGRMLLLVVGDGIRNDVETLADYLQRHAGFHFTLGIVEVAVHQMPASSGFTIQPRVLARTFNVERGIVRIEDGQAVVTSPPAPSAEKGRAPSITEQHLFESLATLDQALPDRLRGFLERASDYGVMYGFGRSLLLKWRDSGGNAFNLGCIYPNGEVETSPVNWMADAIGRLDLAHDYLECVATLIKGKVHRTKHPAGCYLTTDDKTRPSIDHLLDIEDEWLAAIERYTSELERVAETADDR